MAEKSRLGAVKLAYQTPNAIVMHNGIDVKNMTVSKRSVSGKKSRGSKTGSTSGGTAAAEGARLKKHSKTIT